MHIIMIIRMDPIHMDTPPGAHASHASPCTRDLDSNSL